MSFMSGGAEADNRQTHVAYHCDHECQSLTLRMSRTVTEGILTADYAVPMKVIHWYFLGCRFSLSHPTPCLLSNQITHIYSISRILDMKPKSSKMYCILKIFPQGEASLYHYKSEIGSNTRTRAMSWWLLNHCYYTCSCWSMSSSVTLIPIT